MKLWLLAGAALAAGAAYVATRGEALEPVVPAAKPELVELERMIVSLRDAGGSRYLRASIAIELDREPAPREPAPDAAEEPAAAREPDLLAARLRDRALAVLQSRRARDLVAAEAKEDLRAELARTLSPLVEDASLRGVLFTDFLVQ